MEVFSYFCSVIIFIEACMKYLGQKPIKNFYLDIHSLVSNSYGSKLENIRPFKGKLFPLIRSKNGKVNLNFTIA